MVLECKSRTKPLKGDYYSEFEQLDLCDLRKFTIMDDEAEEEKTDEYLYYYWMVEDKKYSQFVAEVKADAR